MAFERIEQFLLPCPFKAVTGIDCPGCGLQRSFIELLRGHFAESLLFYPALIPILFSLLFLILHLIFRFKRGAVILKYSFIFSTAIVAINFIIKIIFPVLQT
jgi:hypothetical protein